MSDDDGPGERALRQVLEAQDDARDQVAFRNSAEGRLRVIAVVSQFWPLIGGAENQARRLATELVRQGLELEVWTARLDRRWPRFEVLDGVTVRRLGSAWSLWGRLRRLARYSFLLSLLVRLLGHRRRYDLVHVHQVLDAAAVAALAGRLARRPVIARVSSTGSTSDLVVSGRGLGITRFLAKRLLTRIVAVNAQAAAECRSWGYRAERIVCIPNGVTVSPVSPSRGHDQEPEVLYVGGLRREKHVDLILEAWRAANCPGRLTIVGDGPEGERLRRLATAADPRVRFLGQVPDARSFFERSDIFVLASDAEGMSNALLEAMASGCACLATWVGGNTDALGPECDEPPLGGFAQGAAGLLVRVGDLPGLAAALSALASSWELRRSLGEAARRRCLARFRVEQVAGAYRLLYGTLVADGSAPRDPGLEPPTLGRAQDRLPR